MDTLAQAHERGLDDVVGEVDVAGDQEGGAQCAHLEPSHQVVETTHIALFEVLDCLSLVHAHPASRAFEAARADLAMYIRETARRLGLARQAGVLR